MRECIGRVVAQEDSVKAMQMVGGGFLFYNYILNRITIFTEVKSWNYVLDWHHGVACHRFTTFISVHHDEIVQHIEWIPGTYFHHKEIYQILRFWVI